MRDGDAEDALPGWLGIHADGGGLGDAQAVRPASFPPHAIRFLNADFTQGYLGIPELDGERYDLLARGGRDRDVDPAYTNDYAVLMSVGPYEVLHPGEYVILDAALAIAPGAEAPDRRGVHQAERPGRDRGLLPAQSCHLRRLHRHVWSGGAPALDQLGGPAATAMAAPGAP